MSSVINPYTIEMRKRHPMSDGALTAINVVNSNGSSYDGKKILYKYTNMDFIESCINSGIYASKIDAVNDPFESEGVKYPHLYRICCMTNSPKKMLLWAYYTNHQECCVEFDVSNIDPELLRQVNYVDTFSTHTNMSLDEVYASLYRKGKEWRHENEFRAVYYEKKYDKSLWNIIGENVFLKAPVKSVTFGLFADRDLQRYKKALEVLIRYGIEGKKCKLRNNRYALEEDRQFDLEIELKRAVNQLKALNESSSTLSLDADEKLLLKQIFDLHGDFSDWIPFEKIVSDPISAACVQNLLNKRLLMMQIQETGGDYKFYYSLTDLGKKYI